MNIGAPEYVWLGLVMFSTAYAFAKHGEPKTGISARHDAWISLVATGLSFGLLYWGGFFA